MTAGGKNNLRASLTWIRFLLLPFAFLLLSAVPAWAEDCVGFYGGVIDGTFVNPAPSQIQIDGNCTIKNFTGSNPLDSNISFYTQPGQNPDRWLVIFDNVEHTGQMSCNSVQGHLIWFTNGSSTGIHQNCQNLLIPVEKINKQNPAGQTAATIGVPFTYKLTIPVLFDPGTGTVINNQGSPNTLHSITVWDDLNATGADLSYVSHVAYWLSDGTPVPHTFSNVGGFLTFDNLPIVPAGQQFVIELTVVLNDSPANQLGLGSQFINTAKWDFGRLIDGTFYEPLPGEWGVTPPMTIAAPALVVDKSGPSTMNFGQWGNFALDLRNVGQIDAWNTSIRDLLPNIPTGGMCDLTPQIISAQVFAADGVTPVPGKGPLNPGTDYSLSYSGAPDCRLELTILSAAGTIGPTQRLIIRYRTQLDANTQNGAILTNIAGATQWFNSSSGNPNRQSYDRVLTTGTSDTPDHEDSQTVTALLTGYIFDKIAADLTSGANPATNAVPGDRLRYTLSFRATTQALNDFRIFDDLGSLNVLPVFVPGTLALVAYPPGADISLTNSTGGTNGTGVIDVRNLNVPVGGDVLIQFDITLAASLPNGTAITNQSTVRLSNGTVFAVSDDPNVNGTADPTVPDDEDRTRVTIVSAPQFVVQKTSTDLSGDPNLLLQGETLRYTITVKNVGNADAMNVVLRDVVPTDTTYVAGSTTLNGAPVADSGGMSPVMSGMLIHSPANPTPGLMPADASSSQANVATVTFDVAVNSGATNGTVISNQGFVTAAASGIVDYPSDDPDTLIANDPTLDIVGTGYLFDKIAANLTSGVNPATTAGPGDMLRYTLRFRATNQALTNVRIFDDLGALNASPVFVPGTLTLVAYPPGADISFTSSTGGTNGTGVIDVRNLNVPAGGEVVIQFDIALASILPNGTAITNQSTLLLSNGTVFALSDDPNVNGTADPSVAGDEDRTRVMILSAPGFVVQKISTDLTGDPNILLAGETLRYTVTVKNAGNADAVNVVLRDVVPANTTYVAGTTTLNGAPVADSGGVSPLVSGMLIHSPANATPGFMPADASNNPANVATVTFTVTVNAGVANGTVISNQGFVTAADSGIIDHPSDDPDTLVADDPTRDIVGTGYLFDKTAANLTSGASPATTASPGERLRYTLRFRTTDQAINNFRIFDDLEALNANPAFVPGTLTLVAYPPGADISGTSSTGGTKGTGVIDVRNLNVATGGDVVIQFDITLASILANGTVLTNQSTLRLSNGTVFALSDDPNVNGTANPDVAGDEDPTRVTIASAPAFVVQKISTDLTGDPNILLAGETLRYTITVKNAGNADAVNVVLRDLVPPNTTYVAGSTTLNGAPVADSAGGSPLLNGMLLNSPANSTPGLMPADASSSQANVATVTFTVVVDSNVVNGTVISNQGFVTAIDNGIVDHPSDDPQTPIANDPTRDVVGNLPLLFADKRVTLSVDLGSPGIVDPGDVLRYTISVQNSAAISATGVILRDSVPANTSYVADSTRLNGLPVPDGGVSPLVAGINVSSSNLTPPLPGPGAGTISPGAVAVLQFDLRVNAGTPSGTVISNQALVSSVELPSILTDGDGNPATGPEPTVVVVGNSQQLSISKQVVVVGGGAAIPGAQLEYTVRVVNIAATPATNVVITDDLNASQPGQLLYVNGSATMNGAATGVTFSGSTITANYAAVSGQLNPGAFVVLRFRATLAPGLSDGTVVTNTGVVAWNSPAQTASASVSVGVGGIPPLAVLNGAAWHDSDLDNARDSGERALAGWTVELYRDSQLVHSVLTDAAGAYRITGVEPNDVSGSAYELRFLAPGAGANTAMLGRATSVFTNGMQRITAMVVPSGANLQNLNLPIQPNGVIYNSLARTPVAGTTLTLMGAGSSSPLPASCFDDAAQQGQITLADGYYKFDVNFSDPACQSGGSYVIGVAPPPGTSYVAGYSQIIPPTSTPSTPPFSVPACPASANDAIPGTALFCEVQASEFAPITAVPPRSAGTTHYVHLRLDGSQMPGTSQIFNNHIPIDPQLLGTVAISKTTPMLNVTRGQLVPYVITVNNVGGMSLTDVSIVDSFPAGFNYVAGSTILDGVPTEPSVAGRQLGWSGLSLAGTQVRTLRLLLAVGAGVTEGEYVNRAHVENGTTGGAMSGEATATVRVMPDPTFDCTDVTGKVFNDANRNGVQDNGEEGLGGVRVVTARGLEATTDSYGRYHITCATTPHESRGSNFVLKLDDRTLPSGFRMSTDQLQIKRATRGKALKFNFGASIHRVIGIDLSDAAFTPGTTEIRVQWQPRLDLLLEELRKAPAVLRLSYVADTEDAALVQRRVEAVKRLLMKSWDVAKNKYVLAIEPEVFWRRGAPPKRPDVRMPEGK
jgi:uncharacterized repeat protein (TIGR01451 family)